MRSKNLLLLALDENVSGFLAFPIGTPIQFILSFHKLDNYNTMVDILYLSHIHTAYIMPSTGKK